MPINTINVEDDVSSQGRYISKCLNILNTKEVKLSFTLAADSHAVKMQSGLN